MLHVFIGSDQVQVRTKAHTHIDALVTGGAVLERYELNNYAPGMCTSLVGGTSLFGGLRVIVFDSFSGDETATTELVECVELCANSSDHIIVIDIGFSPSITKELKAYAKTFFEAKDVTGRFNTFALADALLARDRKTLWLLLIRARRAGISPEELIGTLWWQLKALRLARLASSATEAGLKDFAYSKARRAVSKFSYDDLTSLSESLLTLYHDGHLGSTDIDLALEKWALTI